MNDGQLRQMKLIESCLVMIRKIVIRALAYEAARLYHEDHPGDYSALAQEEMQLDILEEAIKEHGTE